MATAKQAEKPKSAGKSIADFRAAHDKNFIVPQKIRAALTKIADGWEYESDFIRLAGITQTDVGAFREQFAQHVVETRGHNNRRVWAGTEKLADQLRAMVG